MFFNEGLEKYQAVEGHLGIYNGKEFVFEGKSLSYVDIVKLLWRYGVRSLWNLNSNVQSFLKKYKNIYHMQDAGQSFRWDTIGSNIYENIGLILVALGYRCIPLPKVLGLYYSTIMRKWYTIAFGCKIRLDSDEIPISSISISWFTLLFYDFKDILNF